MQIFKKLLYFLSTKEKKNLIILFLMIMIMALIEMMGVASILPFIAVVTNPSLIETNFILSTMFKVSSIFGVNAKQEFIFLLGVLVFVILIFSLTFKAVTTYLQFKFVFMMEYSVGKKLIQTFLKQPYSWFLSRNSAELSKSILSEAGSVSGAMYAIAEIFSNSVITITLLSLLLITNIKLTLGAVLFIGGFYFIIFFKFRKRLKIMGKERLNANELRFKSINEAFGAFKELKVSGLEKIFVNKFSSPAKIYASNQTSSQIINKLPRFIIEGAAFGGMLLLILYIIFELGTLNKSIPIIAVFAFAGYRLIPSIQYIYQSLASLRYNKPSVDKLFNELKNFSSLTLNQDQDNLSFNKIISLNHVNYNYPNSSRSALTDINLTIPYKTTVGIVGSTGCGKTTTVDIILGLLEPQKGTLEIDGTILSQKNI
jgi:ABC-type multidrug transport system fused ATPase/permease subunit